MIVITGAGVNFCAGADVSTFASQNFKTVLEFTEAGQACIPAWEAIRSRLWRPSTALPWAVEGDVMFTKDVNEGLTAMNNRRAPNSVADKSFLRVGENPTGDTGVGNVNTQRT